MLSSAKLLVEIAGAANQKVWIGTVDQGAVQAKLACFSSKDEIPTHVGLGMMKGKRWRLPSTSNTVFWWEPPETEDVEVVNTFLARRGINDLRHRQLRDDVKATSHDHLLNDFSHGRALPPKWYKR